MSNESVLGNDVPALESEVTSKKGGTDRTRDPEELKKDPDVLTDKYGNPPTEKLHRKSGDDGQTWDTYENDEDMTFVRCKRGKADEAKKRAEARASLNDSEVDYQPDSGSEADPEEALTLQEKAENQVDEITKSLRKFLGDEWKPKKKERRDLVEAQIELLKHYPEAEVMGVPWWVRYVLAWGMYVKVRTVGGPSGLFGLVDVINRIGLMDLKSFFGFGEDSEEDEVEANVKSEEEQPDYDLDQEDQDQDGLEKYGIGEE